MRMTKIIKESPMGKLTELENVSENVYNITEQVNFNNDGEVYFTPSNQIDCEDPKFDGQLVGVWKTADLVRMRLKDFPSKPPRTINVNGKDFTLVGVDAHSQGELVNLKYYDNVNLYNNIDKEKDFVLHEIDILTSKSYLQM